MNSVLGTLLRDMALTVAAPVAVVTPQEPEIYLPLPERIRMLEDKLARLATQPQPLVAMRAELAGLLSTSFDPDSVNLALLPLRVDRTLRVVVEAAPLIRWATKLVDNLEHPLSDRAEDVRDQLITAIVAAWQPVSNAATLARARRLKDALSEHVALRTLAYQQLGTGLGALIGPMQAARDFVVSARLGASPPRPLSVWPSGTPLDSRTLCLNEMGLAGTVWPLRALFEQERTTAFTLWEGRESTAPARTRSLERRVGVYSLIMQALAIDEELLTILDRRTALDFVDSSGEGASPVPIEYLSTSLDRHRGVLDTQVFAQLSSVVGPLASIRAALANGDAGQLANAEQALDAVFHHVTAAQAALGGFLSSSDYVSDRRAAIDRLALIDTIRTTALIIGIGVVAALTGGAAGAAVGATIASVSGEAALLGLISWGGIASVATEAVVFTAINRAGTTLAFGPPDPHRAESFWQEVFWNAAGSVVARAFTVLRTQLLRPPDIASFRFRASLRSRAANYAADQIVMTGFSVFQEYVRHDKLLSTDEITSSVLQQLVTDALIGLGRHAAQPLRARLGTAAPTLDQNRITTVDNGAQALDKVLDKVRSREATEQERRDLPKKVEEQWTAGLELIKTLPDGTPERTSLLLEYRTARARTELELAIFGLETAFSGPQPPQFAPVGDRAVAFAAGAKSLLDAYYVSRGGAVERLPGPTELWRGSYPGSDPVHFYPIELVPIRPAASGAIEPAFSEAIAASDVSNLAHDGLETIKERFPAPADQLELLGRVGVDKVAWLLTFLAHPDFTSPAGQSAPPTVANPEILALVASPAASRFAERYSPDLAVRLLRVYQAKTFTPEVVAALDRAERIIEGTPAATRAALLAELPTLGPMALESWVNPQDAIATPPTPAPDIDLVSGAAVPNSAQWTQLVKSQQKALAKRNLQPGVNYSPAQFDALIRVESIVENGRRREIQSLTSRQRRAIVRDATDLCAAAGNLISASQRAAMITDLTRRLFLPFSHVRYYRNGSKYKRPAADMTRVLGRERRGAPGSDGDFANRTVNTILVELRFDQMNNPTTRAALLAELDARIIKALADVPSDERIDLVIPWYPPDDAAIAELMARVSQHGRTGAPGENLPGGAVGSRVAAVKLGDGDRIPVGERPGAVRKDSKGRTIPETVIRLPSGRLPGNAAFAGRVYTGLSKKLRTLYGDIAFTAAGFPIWGEHVLVTVEFPPPGFAGNHGTDFTRADALCRQEYNFTPPDGYTWHHNEDGIHMELIPTRLHDAIRHAGGVAIKKYR